MPAPVLEEPLSPTSIDVFLGEYPCDVPFGGGETETATLSLTTASPRSKHGIPVLRVEAGHRMDFRANEQTPAGNAALLVARWLNDGHGDERERHAAELFLWQWPGVEQNSEGRWQLSDLDARRTALTPPFVDCHGNTVAIDDPEALLDSLNLQPAGIGFCRKQGPCFLSEACLMCEDFVTTKASVDALRKRREELLLKRDDAAIGNHQRLVEACQEAIENIGRMIRALES